MDTSKISLPITLKGENYLLWSRTTKTVLCSRGLWNHITSTRELLLVDKNEGEIVPVPEDEKWFQENQTVLALLQSSLAPPILTAYSYCETAKDLWDTLRGVYGNVSNLSRIFEVKKSLNNISQDERSFSEHFGDYRSLWAELEMLRPPTVDPTVLNERREQDQVFGLLSSLNPGYNDLIKHILRSEKLPSLNNVCMQIQKEEGSLGLFGKKEDLVLANKGAYKHNERRSVWCDHCKRKGHVKEKCWLLHPHLKPTKFKEEGKTFVAHGVEDDKATTSVATREDLMTKSDFKNFINYLKDPGNVFLSHKISTPLVVDSGASHHMIKDDKLINQIEPTSGKVTIANGKSIDIKGIGNLKLFDRNSNAFYVPEFTSNLLSVRKATKDLGCEAVFTPNKMWFQDTKTGRKIGEGSVKDGLYVLEDFNYLSHNAIANNVVAWHDRLGHPHDKALKLIFPTLTFESKNCEACILGKHCRTVFPNSTTLYENCFELIHSDVWTAPCLARDQNKYFVTFIDEKSKYTWLTLLPSKGRVCDAFSSFYSYVSTQYNAKIKVLRSDNGGEYTSHEFKEFLSKKGILHQTSCPYTPQQNGVAERKNRHLMEVTRSIMFAKNVPKRFWGDAVLVACYLINRIPTRCLQDKSPFEVLNNLKPSFDHLKVFGCVCFALISEGQRNKLEPKSIRCMFIGYSTGQKGYKCYNPENNRVYVSREVKFLEEKGFYEERNWETLQDLSESRSGQATNLRTILENITLENKESGDMPNGQGTKPTMSPITLTLPHVHDEHDMINSPSASQDDTLSEPIIDEPSRKEQSLEHDEMIVTQNTRETPHEDDEEITEEIPLRRSQRIRKAPSKFYNANVVAHPIQAVCSLAHMPTNHQVFVSKIDQVQVPNTYKEAMTNKKWMDAVNDEVGAMNRNKTWVVSDLPKGKKTVGSRWVFTIKYKSNGDIERYKARLVARGFTQTHGIDYNETFAPVAKLHTVRVLLSCATNLSWDLWQMDVKNAFLQGELDEEVYMTPPPGLEDTVPLGKILKLQRAIYGLKQSPRAWYHKLSNTLIGKGFRKSQSDHSLFTQQSERGIIVVLVYVDDIILSGDDSKGIKDTKQHLKDTFDIKDLGELKYFLGIEICRTNKGLFLSQRKYALDLLNETGKLGCKPAITPIEEGYQDRKGEDQDQVFENIGQYQRTVGKLIYLTITRPDLSFSVNQVSQHMHAPTNRHWDMVERILRYIKNAPGRGIWMGNNNNTDIVGYCDADWAGDKMDRRSTTGYCTFIGGNLVTWRSKKQKVVSRSSAEAEYRAMATTTDELIWLRALLKDLGVEINLPTIMHCDNQAAIHIASNSVFHERTKHIEVDCHHIREKVEMGIILPTYTKSSDQLADIFTKATSSKICNYIHGKLGLTNPHHP